MTEAEKLEEALKESAELLEGVQEIEEPTLVEQTPAALPKSIGEAMIRLTQRTTSAKFTKSQYNKFTKKYYADINDILLTLRPILRDLNMRLAQNITAPRPDEIPANLANTGYNFIKCVTEFSALLDNGQVETVKYESFAMAVELVGKIAQEQGGAQTYLKRYHLVGLLGLPLEADNDGEPMTNGTPANSTINAQQLRALKGAIAETAQRTHRPIVEIERDITQRGQVSSIEKLSAELFESAMAYIKGMS